MLSADKSGRLLTYYQDPDGRVIENSYLNGSWTLDNSTNINNSVVTTQTAAGSPLAAISYVNNGLTYRQVFFLDSTGTVRSTNSSTTSNNIATSWGAPIAIATDTASPNSIGLAACTDSRKTGMGGIRVYYGSSSGCIQEVGYAFNSTGWTEWFCFDGSDQDAGVACAVYDGPNNAGNGTVELINLYLRNSTTGAVTQNFWDYQQNDGWYYCEPLAFLKSPPEHELTRAQLVPPPPQIRPSPQAQISQSAPTTRTPNMSSTSWRTARSRAGSCSLTLRTTRPSTTCRWLRAERSWRPPSWRAVRFSCIRTPRARPQCGLRMFRGVAFCFRILRLRDVAYCHFVRMASLLLQRLSSVPKFNSMTDLPRLEKAAGCDSSTVLLVVGSSMVSIVVTCMWIKATGSMTRGVLGQEATAPRQSN